MNDHIESNEGAGAGFSPVPCPAFLERAVANVAKWGKQDLETLGLAIAEETGELCQAILKARWEGGDRERIREEVIDLGALCHQVMLYLDHPPCAACDRGDYQLGHSDHCPQGIRFCEDCGEVKDNQFMSICKPCSIKRRGARLSSQNDQGEAQPPAK